MMRKYFLLLVFLTSNQSFSLVISDDVLAHLHTNVDVLAAENSVEEYQLLVQEVHEKEWHPSINVSATSFDKKTTGSMENSIDKSIQGLDNFLTVPSRVDRENKYREDKLNIVLSSNLYNGHQSIKRINFHKLLLSKERYNLKQTVDNLYIEVLENTMELCYKIQKEGVMIKQKKVLSEYVSNIEKYTTNKIKKLLLNEKLTALKQDINDNLIKQDDIKTWFELSFESRYPIDCNSLLATIDPHDSIKNEIDSQSHKVLINTPNTRFNNNIDIKISDLNYQIANLKYKIKKNDYLPKIDFIFSYDKVFQGINDLKEDTYIAGFQLKFPLYKPGHTPRKNILHNRIKQSKYNIKKTRLRVRNSWSKLISSYKKNMHILKKITLQSDRLALEISRNNVVRKKSIESNDLKYNVNLIKLEKKYLLKKLELIKLKIKNITP